ncbi:MAG TPA: hypothetical protein VK980_18690 [Sphingomonas sp.]|nr:hypothetical protein [Sphingomonas sp.]
MAAEQTSRKAPDSAIFIPRFAKIAAQMGETLIPRRLYACAEPAGGGAASSGAPGVADAR